MKKILNIICVSILAITMMFGLASCGNYNISWGSYSFHYVHVQMYGGECVHLKVNSWKNDDGGIEIKTENHGTILLGDGTYMMYDEELCPICGKVSYK